MWRENVIDVHVIEGVRRYAGRELRIGIAVSEEEHEARKARGEFVDQVGGNQCAPRQGEILGWPVDFASRRESGEDRGTAIQQVALELLLRGPHRSKENVISGVEGVIDAQ